MKVLVIGGMHGNETLGIKVVELFKEQLVKNVDVVVANEQAVEANCRFVGKDLNRSFPGDGDDYEDKRAEEIVQLSKNYDVVLDFHNTYCSNNDCSFIGDTADKELKNISMFLGLRRTIIADYDCINKYASNCISIEISMDSERNDPKLWYELIKDLSKLQEMEPKQEPDLYRFVYRMTLQDKKEYNLEKEKLKAFEPISVELAKKMNIKTPAYPIFIDDKFTEYNYGGLLNKL